ncbi:MAG TPA: nuclear transport factor 2 family protein [Polyangiaceae bacterium]
MSTEANKATVKDFFARLSAKDVSGALDLLADDATWRLPGKPGSTPIVGERSKAQMARLFQNMMSNLKDGLTMTVKSLIAEGDRVAVETESLGELQNGRVYNNHYHFSMTLADGKIRVVHEYYDTQHAIETWFAP